MKYAYQDLSADQFEILVVYVCQEILGISVQGFAKGPDGGRDAKFVGTAQLHPSKTAPWVGTVIIQAKHTNGLDKHFSESDFYSPTDGTETVLSEEVFRIRKLRDSSQLDHYMLFSNRRLAGNAESEIRAYISKCCGIPLQSIYLCGVEQLEMWLKRFPTAAELADIDPIDSPLIVGPDELSLVVTALAANRETVQGAIDDPPSIRVPYEVKNRLNNMTPVYAKNQRKLYLKETAQIAKFLAAPENQEVLEMYQLAVNEFNFKIIAKRKNYQEFDQVMEYLVDLLFKRDVILRQNKRLTRTMLFYMYWNCDLGEDEDASAN